MCAGEGAWAHTQMTVTCKRVNATAREVSSSHNVASRSHSGHRLGGRPHSLLAFTLVLEIQTRVLMPEQQTVNPQNCFPSPTHLCPTGSVYSERGADAVSLSTEERPGLVLPLGAAPMSGPPGRARVAQAKA